jgi:hypothetical protein
VISRLGAWRFSLALAGGLQAQDPAAWMPGPRDHTLMYWAEGFPGSAAGRPWRRVIRTGTFALALDTDTLRVPHFGRRESASDYAAAARADALAVSTLPPAALTLTLQVGDRTYSATGSAPWSPHAGPRLVESGRFFQRGDVTGLRFTGADGQALPVEARLETFAWPDRLGISLFAAPGGTGASWPQSTLAITLQPAQGPARRVETRIDPPWTSGVTAVTTLLLDPNHPEWQTGEESLTLAATDAVRGKPLAVRYDPTRAAHAIDLDGSEAALPAGQTHADDALYRTRLTLHNARSTATVARLVFALTGPGLRHPTGSPPTGLSAVLRDRHGHPLGLPVQLSKNWHHHSTPLVHSGTWFHGYTQVRVPPGETVELELARVHGHWGGRPAASHAQLSLIGWGSNQLWDQAALGSWGESVCFEPDQVQASCLLTDLRPLYTRAMSGKPGHTWTHNVGGADAFRLFAPDGERVRPATVRTAYLRQGPCLTEVAYTACLGTGAVHTTTVSLMRSDDLVRVRHQLRLDVTQPTPFSRLVLFQVGSDRYNYTGERRFAVGNAAGLLREWDTTWGGDRNRTEPLECTGPLPWLSLHRAEPREPVGAWANRGLVIRAWQARLGGRAANPWMVERGVQARGRASSTADLVPPPGVQRLEPGDFLEAVVDLLVLPRAAEDYLGPDPAWREALRQHGDDWRLVHREAVGNDVQVAVQTGALVRAFPATTVRAQQEQASLTFSGGWNLVPFTVTGVRAPGRPQLELDGQPWTPEVHGGDGWQTDWDAEDRTWSHTFNLPAPAPGESRRWRYRVAAAP